MLQPLNNLPVCSREFDNPSVPFLFGICLLRRIVLHVIFILLLLVLYFLPWDIMAWERFPQHWPFVRGIHRSLADSPHKGPVKPRFNVLLATLDKLLARKTKQNKTKQTVDLSVIWDARTLLWRHRYGHTLIPSESHLPIHTDCTCILQHLPPPFRINSTGMQCHAFNNLINITVTP